MGKMHTTVANSACANGIHFAMYVDAAGNSIVRYVVKVYDPLGTVPAFYRGVGNTWVPTTFTEPLQVFATERAARAFIATQRPFTALEMCVEAV